MKLWKFTVVSSVDYNQYDSFVIIAESEKDAGKILKKRVEFYGQKPGDFNVREVKINEEQAGVLCASYNAG